MAADQPLLKMIPEMTSFEAIETAIEALNDIAADTDTASPRGHTTRLAIATLTAILEQKGCEHFDPAIKSGHLVDLIDLIVFG